MINDHQKAQGTRHKAAPSKKMAPNINGLTIPIARKLLSSQRLTPSQLALYCHSIAQQSQEHFNAFSNLFPLEEILASAAESDKRHKDGRPRGALDGIPISIKCNIAIEGKDLSASSNILSNAIGYDSHVAKRLKDCGAILMGSTNMDEFGMGSLGTNCNLGYATNPVISLSKYPYQYSVDDWVERIQSLSMPEHIDKSLCNDGDGDVDVALSPGGSSSGSAVSVAIGSSLASIGTDTGGS